MTTTDVLEMKSATVGDIAVSYPQAIGILNRYNLDFCCNGGRRFVAACGNLKLDAGSVWHEILEASHQPETSQRMRFETWATPFLVDYIVQNHHEYVRQSTTRILELLTKVEAAHSEGTPEVVQVKLAFEQLTKALEHMTKEEVLVFPTVLRMAALKESPIDGPLAMSIVAPLITAENEHEEAGRLIHQIRSLTNNYTPPAYACPTFQLTWKLLKEFDDDLMQHIHLENNILFPRVRVTV